MLIRVLDHPPDRKSLALLDGSGVYIFSTLRSASFPPDSHLPEEIIGFLQNKNVVCYVGKAKHLSQRLKTYRSPGGATAGDWYKANKLHDSAKSIIVISVPTHFEACLLELFLIRILAPQLNSMSTGPGRLFFVQQNFEKRLVFATPQRLKGMKTWGCMRVKSELRAAFDVLHDILDFYDPVQDTLKIRPIDSAAFRSTRGRRYSLHVVENHTNTVTQVLRGKKAGLLQTLWRSMRAAADEQQFHHAARLRDAYQALRQLQLQLMRSRRIMRNFRSHIFCIRDKDSRSGRDYILSKYSFEQVIPSAIVHSARNEGAFCALMNWVIGTFKSQFEGKNDVERMRVNFEFLRLMIWWLDHQPEECATRSLTKA